MYEYTHKHTPYLYIHTQTQIFYSYDALGCMYVCIYTHNTHVNTSIQIMQTNNTYMGGYGTCRYDCVGSDHVGIGASARLQFGMSSTQAVQKVRLSVCPTLFLSVFLFVCLSVLLCYMRKRSTPDLLTQLHTLVHAHVHTNMHTDIHTCIHTCLHTVVHTYMHTRTHTHIQGRTGFALTTSFS
jgi:hypothetical protein